MTTPPLFAQGLIAIIEAALNRYLRLDPDTLPKLQALSGKVIALELTDLNRTLYLAPGPERIKVLGSYEGITDARLRGTSLAMLRMSVQKSDSHEARTALFSGAVEIDGDVELGRRFKAILDTLDIDWEELLSKGVGDVLAHQLGNVARGAQQWSARTFDTLGQNFAEYQQEESRNLPRQEDVTDFLAAVDTLRDDVARLEQRVSRLRQRLAEREPKA